MFWISIAANIIQIVVFDLWGTAEVQPWNEPQEKRTGDSVEVSMPNSEVETATPAEQK